MAKVKAKTKNNEMIRYMDDILVGSNSAEEMAEKLTLNPSTYEFVKTTIEYLGHQLSTQGNRLATIKTNITELRIFLGLSGYFRKFLPGYGPRLKTLRLTK